MKKLTVVSLLSLVLSLLLIQNVRAAEETLAFAAPILDTPKQSSSIVQVQQTGCLPLGGYPFSQNGCIFPSDLNKALQQNAGPLPPQNGSGKGANQFSFWVDTSTGSNTPTLRQCTNANGCSPTYTVSDWIAWGQYNITLQTFTFSASFGGGGGGGPGYTFNAPLQQSGGVVSILLGNEFSTSGGVLHLNSLFVGVTQTSNYSVTSLDNYKAFNNNAATNPVTFTLPSVASSNGQTNCYIELTSQLLTIQPNGSDRIVIGSTVGSAGGTLTTSTANSSVCITANNVGQWVVSSAPDGTWTLNGTNSFTLPTIISFVPMNPANNLADVSNAAQSRTNLAVLPHVPDNATLSAATRAQFPGTVIRDTYGNGNGAPAQQFTSQVGTCAANSMTSDGGSCQNGSDGNSFFASYDEGGIVDARQFGVKCDGSTDNSSALQAAVNLSNHLVTLPTNSPGTCKYSTGLVIGNGVSGVSISTVNNVHIGSLLTPQQWLAAFPLPNPALEYTGSGAAITFQGQMTGGGIQGVRLTCDNNAATGIHYISTIGLTSENFMIQGCKIPTQPEGVASLAPGTFNGDAYGGSWRNFNIELPAVTGAIGINLSSAGNWDVDMEKWDHGNVTFDPLGSGTRTCIYAGFGDTDTVTDTHCLIIGGRTDTINAIVTDYSTSCGISGCNVFPNSIHFRAIDTGESDNNGYSVVGSPSTAAGPNFVDEAPINNGSNGGPIGVAHLWPDTTPWHVFNGTSFTCTGGGTATGTADVHYRQIRDTYQIFLAIVITPSSCTGSLKVPLWATSPCNTLSGAPRWNLAGTNLTEVKTVQGIIDATASPQMIEMFNYDGTVPVTGSSVQGISLSGFCQYSGGP